MIEKSQEGRQQIFSAIAFAWELGYTIVIPIVFFALLGRLLDTTLGPRPMFLFAVILASFLIPLCLVLRKPPPFL